MDQIFDAVLDCIDAQISNQKNKVSIIFTNPFQSLEISLQIQSLKIINEIAYDNLSGESIPQHHYCMSLAHLKAMFDPQRYSEETQVHTITLS